MSRADVTTAGALQWFGVLGAPFAWTTQFVCGVALSQVACRDVGSLGWVTDVNPSVAVLSAVAFLVALCAGGAALATHRRSAEADEHDAPPAGRMQFLSQIGMTITPLFLVLIALTFVGFQLQGGCKGS